MSELEVSDDFDADSRELCPDGACVGVLGDDGKCKVCGRAGEPSAKSKPKSAKPASESAPESASASEPASASDPSSPSDPDIASRELCPDGSCIGVIGSDGKCKVCGRALHS